MSAILFDFNGTMIFDTPIVERSWLEFLHNHNVNASLVEVRPWLHGLDPIDTIKHFFPSITDSKSISNLVEEKESLYRKLCPTYKDTSYKLVDGLPDFLDECKQKKIKMTIATAAPLNNVKFFFESLDLYKWFNFDDVIFCDGSFPGKPDPTIYLMAAKRLETPIKECIIFEDAISGLTAAVKSNCKYVFGLMSLLNEKQILELGANKAIKDFTDQKYIFSILNK